MQPPLIVMASGELSNGRSQLVLVPPSVSLPHPPDADQGPGEAGHIEAHVLGEWHLVRMVDADSRSNPRSHRREILLWVDVQREAEAELPEKGEMRMVVVMMMMMMVMMMLSGWEHVKRRLEEV